MMKRIFLLVIIAMFLTACGEDLPPAPAPPGVAAFGGKAIAGMAGAMPSWAAPARNAALTPTEVVFDEGVVVTVSNYDYVYKNAYFFNSQIRTWEKFELAGDEVSGWLRGTGIGNIAAVGSKFAPGNNYVVVYACNKAGKTWDCNGNKWMLLQFKIVGVSEAPQIKDIDRFVIDEHILPFRVVSTFAELDDWTLPDEKIDVMRYDATYRGPYDAMVHVFDHNTRADVNKAASTLLREIINRGWTVHQGNSVALYVTAEDHQVALWTSGKQVVWIEMTTPDYVSEEVLLRYLQKYPSDLRRQ